MRNWRSRLLAFSLSAAAAVGTAPAVVAIGRERLLPGTPVATWSAWVLPAALLLLALLPEWWREKRGAGLLPVAGAAALGAMLDGRFSANVAAVLLVGAPAAVLQAALGTRLSPHLDSQPVRQRAVLALWAAATLLLVLQAGRLAAYHLDPASDWWLTTRHELWARHMCAPAYVQAADLHRQGEPNVYDARHYLGLDRAARPRFTVANLEPFAGDPFQYPPPFLAATVLALRLSNDFLVLRAAWFSLQALVVLLSSYLLAGWLARESTAAFWLLPAFLLSVPALQALQFGQAHASAVALSVGGMLAIEKRREAWGGAMLAAAILAKMFPGVLLLLLVVGRRWKAVWWTAAFGVAFAGAAWSILGPAPFHAFASYQLPRLADGRAFAFLDAWPEWTGWLVADNLSPYGVITKLRHLGVPAMSEGLARMAGNLFVAAILAATVAAGRRSATRIERARTWLALLALASLQGRYAFGDYVTFPAVWLLSILPFSVYAARRARPSLFACWAFCALVPGVVPTPLLWPTKIALAVTAAGSMLLVAFCLWAITARASSTAPASATAAAPS